jgi:hypothetical protein
LIVWINNLKFGNWIFQALPKNFFYFNHVIDSWNRMNFNWTTNFYFYFCSKTFKHCPKKFNHQIFDYQFGLWSLEITIQGDQKIWIANSSNQKFGHQNHFWSLTIAIFFLWQSKFWSPELVIKNFSQ